MDHSRAVLHVLQSGLRTSQGGGEHPRSDSGDDPLRVYPYRRVRETYSERNEIILQDVFFREYDQEGNLLTEAQADRAVFATDSENATVSGSIQIYSHEEQASLQAGRLSWVSDGRRLVADDGQTVRLQKDDGSYVEGEGFSADFRRKRLEFSSRVRGSYVREEEDEE